MSKNAPFSTILRYRSSSYNFQYEVQTVPRLVEKSIVFHTKIIFKMASNFL